MSFDETGRLTAPLTGNFLDEVAAAGVTDLFLFSHGWGTSEKNARALYDAMFPMIRDAATGVAAVGSLGFAGVYWPSLWFPDTPATAARSGGSTQAADGAQEEARSGSAEVSGAEIAESLLPGFAQDDQRAAVTELGRLIDQGAAAAAAVEPAQRESEAQKEERLQRIQELVRTLAPALTDRSAEDAGESGLLLTADPKQAYQGVAEVFGSAPPGASVQGIGDWFSTAINGAKDAVRVLSYSIMKARAGDIGRAGVGELLAALHTRTPQVRVHLVGHSFGARLVAFALSGIQGPEASPVASLLLLQGAFSHWSFAHEKDNPFAEPGALHAFADRVHGPLVATHSVFDWAVCRWYPKASFLARQDTQGVDVGRWDGMGADGYQAVTPSADIAMSAAGGTDYPFSPHVFYRVDAAEVINNVTGQPFAGAHSDILKPAVAELVVAAAAAHET
jgi:hypothetical protein